MEHVYEMARSIPGWSLSWQMCSGLRFTRRGMPHREAGRRLPADDIRLLRATGLMRERRWTAHDVTEDNGEVIAW